MKVIITFILVLLSIPTVAQDFFIPKYKLYPTDNIWTFLKLNTATGAIHKVQYSIKGEDYRFQKPILATFLLTAPNSEGTEEPIVIDSTALQSGRFELHETQNMFNFLLIDQLKGNIWQVQWDSGSESVVRIPSIIE